MRPLIGILVVVLALVTGILIAHPARSLAPDVPSGLYRARRRAGGDPP